jgi:hypothetical protein
MKHACRRATELVSASMDRRLTLRERCELWIHIPCCRACRVYRGQVRRMRDLIRRMPLRVLRAGAGDVRLSAEARGRIESALAARPPTRA